MLAPRRIVTHYLVMVGVPVIGILIVLELGRSLTAAPAIAGRWQIEPAAPLHRLAACLSGGTPADLVLSISQSGQYLAGRLGRADASAGMALEGTLRARTVSLTAAAPADGCSGPLVLSATIVGDGAGRRLQGALHERACPRCGKVPITARRVPAGPELAPEEP
ncbi:MAG TPA: hypothetical protein VNE16_02585 [Vicinamibacterales bacterium]|nr:hypothetical protein [Vicinamibacterales bacterium]